MNPIIISTIIGVASFILTIFSATYLSQRHTDKLIEQLEKRFEARIDALAAELKGEIKRCLMSFPISRLKTFKPAWPLPLTGNASSQHSRPDAALRPKPFAASSSVVG